MHGWIPRQEPVPPPPHARHPVDRRAGLQLAACMGLGGDCNFFADRSRVFLFVASIKSAMADATPLPPPPLAHAASLQPLQRPPSPVFRAPLDLVVTAGGSDIPLDINLAVRGIHVPSLQYRIQQQQQQHAFRREHRDHHQRHRRPPYSVPNVTVERVPPLPPPPPPPPRLPVVMVSSLSAASASHSQFDAATNANQVILSRALSSILSFFYYSREATLNLNLEGTS